MAEDLTADELVSGQAPEADRLATEAARAATDLVERSDPTLPARHRYDRSQVEVIKGSVAPGLRDIELAWFLEVSARYGLDPLLKEIYAVKFDGDSGGVTIFTGRDGLLAAARKTKRLVRMQSHVVREKDEFRKVIDTAASMTEDREVLMVHHEQVGMGSEARGAIVGAYALVWTTDSEHPWYAEATWEEYGVHRQKDNKHRDTAWTTDSKKGYPEAMMVKVAESICLRKACGLSGLVGKDEIQKQLGPGDAPAVLSGEGVTPASEPPEGPLGDRIRELVARANELVPGSYRPAKVAMEMGMQDDEALDKFIGRLERFILPRSPDDPLIVVDATVVEEPPEVPLVEWDEEVYERVLGQIADIEAGLEESGVSDETAERANEDLRYLDVQQRALEAARDRLDPGEGPGEGPTEAEPESDLPDSL